MISCPEGWRKKIATSVRKRFSYFRVDPTLRESPRLRFYAHMPSAPCVLLQAAPEAAVLTYVAARSARSPMDGVLSTYERSQSDRRATVHHKPAVMPAMQQSDEDSQSAHGCLAAGRGAWRRIKRPARTEARLVWCIRSTTPRARLRPISCSCRVALLIVQMHTSLR